MEVRYREVSKDFDGVPALAPLDLTVPDGEFLALLGPSGCGKTTALRLLAGLERPTEGSIFIGDRDVTRLEPRERDVAMVFQSYALYPHMSVANNIGYPLRLRRVAPGERRAEVERVAGLLGIEQLLERAPRQLSGGQRQRVALARAIVRHPSAFLMDEPLSNLDAQLRTQMRAEIKRLQRELAVTTLYVTHDQVEAMTMADHVAVLKDGVLQQLATPARLYEAPANLFVARFCGSPPMNLLEGHVVDGTLRHPAGELKLAALPERGPLTFGFRPEHATIGPAGAPGSLRGEVYVVEPLGNETLVAVSLGADRVNVRMPASYRAPVGDPCGVVVASDALHLFDHRSGEAMERERLAFATEGGEGQTATGGARSV